MKEELVAEITLAMEIEAILYAALRFEDEAQADKIFDTFLAGGTAAMQIVTDVMSRVKDV